eukprot:GAHX01003991.1.p1 GENE.GAHX01003991.1~~GAHX01003991.1.p1  ORF type:complete len:106 (+),score=23.17 GAHX01003991.1:409-726(+)
MEHYNNIDENTKPLIKRFNKLTCNRKSVTDNTTYIENDIVSLEYINGDTIEKAKENIIERNKNIKEGQKEEEGRKIGMLTFFDWEIPNPFVAYLRMKTQPPLINE